MFYIQANSLAYGLHETYRSAPCGFWTAAADTLLWRIATLLPLLRIGSGKSHLTSERPGHYHCPNL